MPISIRTLALSVLAVAVLTAVATLTSQSVEANHLECSNGIDDDGDGRTDFPQDPDCSSSDENAEAANGRPVSSVSSAASVTAVSSSSVSVVAQGTVFEVTVSDNRQTVAPGDRLSYAITVKNVTGQTQTSDVILTASRFVLVETVTPDTNVEANIAVWRAVSFNANETKTFTFVGTVDASTPASSSVNMQVRVGSANAVDATTVQPGVVASSVSSVSLSSASSAVSVSSARSSSVPSDTMLFSRTADMNTVVPGAVIRYTIQVKNTRATPIANAIVDERFNPTLLTAVETAGATIVGPGQMRWTLATIAPGQTWQQSYTLRVSANAANGVKLTNVASLTGRDVGTVSLDKRVLTQTVTVTSAGAASSLPSTGGVMDLLFVLATLPAAAGAALVQRKLRA